MQFYLDAVEHRAINPKFAESTPKKKVRLGSSARRGFGPLFLS